MSYRRTEQNCSACRPKMVGGAPSLSKLKRIMSQRVHFALLQFPLICLFVYQGCLAKFAKVALVWQPYHSIETELSAFAATVFPTYPESMAEVIQTGLKTRMSTIESVSHTGNLPQNTDKCHEILS